MLWKVGFAFALVAAAEALAQSAHQNQEPVKVDIPTLIEDRSGNAVFGLTAGDFNVEVDGVEKTAVLEKSSADMPSSMVLVIQTGHGAQNELKEISRIGSMLSALTLNPKDEVGIVGFDSNPHLLQPLTNDQEALTDTLTSLAPGNSGAALYDALQLALLTLNKAPMDGRKVILLISEGHDRGSVGVDETVFTKELVSANISLYNLTAREAMGHIFHGFGKLNPAVIRESASRKDPGETLANLSGGDSYHFANEREFEDRATKVANHIHDVYCLRLGVVSSSPGMHVIEVTVKRDGVHVSTQRRVYWVDAPSSR